MSVFNLSETGLVFVSVQPQGDLEIDANNPRLTLVTWPDQPIEISGDLEFSEVAPGVFQIQGVPAMVRIS